MKQVIVVTATSSGFGSLAARALANAGYTVHASMRETTGRNAVQVKSVQEFATTHKAGKRKRHFGRVDCIGLRHATSPELPRKYSAACAFWIRGPASSSLPPSG
jgi:NAD(P)-dependent dehydrogenase (short-subunit alcohol dehydrogenase family)